MSQTDISQTTTTSTKTGVPDYSVSSKVIDENQGEEEYYWYNNNFPQYLGYYKTIPELKQAIDSLAMWVAGKGWTADIHTTNNINLLSGWGEDTWDSIMQNMIVVKKINGDSYCEIIKDGNIVRNLKPLNPMNVRHVTDSKGIIKRYDVWQKGEWKAMKPDKIFHISNNRIASEAHGVSVIESVKWIIDARNEAMSDYRRILHRSSIRVIYVDEDDTTKLTTLKTQYKDAIKNGELMILPLKKGEAEFEDLTPPNPESYLAPIRYYENVFYQSVGVPKIILGGTSDTTEASSKVGYLVFEQCYMTEQRLLEQDILYQLGWEIKFDRPVSLKEDMMSSEAANTGQVGFQPNEMQTGVGRNE